MLNYIVYQGQKIEYQVLYKKVKNINLRVKSDLSVVVTASKDIGGAELERIVLEKAQWIIRSQAHLRERAEEYRQNQLINTYHDDGKIAFLGQYLPLQLTASNSADCTLAEGRLLIGGSCSEGEIEVKVEQFYRQQSILVFEGIHEQIYPLFADLGLPKAQFSVRKMTASWGRCHIQKCHIVLNWQLIKAPIDCIRAVIIHEYVHFIYPDHSKNFYQKLKKLEPAYEALSRQLAQSVRLK